MGRLVFEPGWLQRQIKRASDEVKGWSKEKKVAVLCPQRMHEWENTGDIDSLTLFIGVKCVNCGYEEWHGIESNFRDHWGTLNKEIESE